MSALFKRFSYHLTRSPILTNVVSGSTVLVVGDCIAQAIERRRGRAVHHDPVRTTVMLGWAGKVRLIARFLCRQFNSFMYDIGIAVCVCSM
jgi:hypothetical protein